MHHAHTTHTSKNIAHTHTHTHTHTMYTHRGTPHVHTHTCTKCTHSNTPHPHTLITCKHTHTHTHAILTRIRFLISFLPQHSSIFHRKEIRSLFDSKKGSLSHTHTHTHTRISHARTHTPNTSHRPPLTHTCNVYEHHNT